MYICTHGNIFVPLYYQRGRNTSFNNKPKPISIMAKYKIVLSCGHEEEVQLFGPHKEREKQLAYLQANAKCFSCKNEERENQRRIVLEKALATADSYPQLQGTEKQITWALQIRQQWIDEIQELMISQNISWDNTILKFCDLPDFKKEEILEQPLDRHYLCKIAHILTETSAVFFIENRS